MSDPTTDVPAAQARFAELGLVYPPAPQRMGNFASCVQVGELLFTCGQGSHDVLGTVGEELDVEDGYRAAREAMLRTLQLVEEELGTLDRVERIVKLLGFVNCRAGFDRSPLVLNGASDLLVEVFGERGRHARSAIGAVALPHRFAVEIEAIVQVRP